jgi:hypothetical protein
MSNAHINHDAQQEVFTSPTLPNLAFAPPTLPFSQEPTYDPPLFPPIATPPQAHGSFQHSPSASPPAGLDSAPGHVDLQSAAITHLSPPPDDLPLLHLGPCRLSRKRMKRVCTAPMTVAERHHISQPAAPSSTIPEDPAVVELQLRLAFADDQPQHEGDDLVDQPQHKDEDLMDQLQHEDDDLVPLISDSQDINNQPADILVPPSDFPIQSSDQSPHDLYLQAHQNWFVRLIFLLIAILHTRHHVTFCACSLLLFTLSLIFHQLSLTSSKTQIPFTLDTVLLKLDLEDRFTIAPACEICQRLFQRHIPSDSQCLDCNTDLFIAPSATLFQRLTGKRPPSPPPKLSVPVRTLSSLLTDALAHGPLEDQVQEWQSHTQSPNQFTGFMS